MRERLGVDKKAGLRHLADEWLTASVLDPFPRKLVYDGDAGACSFEQADALLQLVERTGYLGVVGARIGRGHKVLYLVERHVGELETLDEVSGEKLIEGVVTVPI